MLGRTGATEGFGRRSVFAETRTADRRAPFDLGFFVALDLDLPPVFGWGFVALFALDFAGRVFGFRATFLGDADLLRADEDVREAARLGLVLPRGRGDAPCFDSRATWAAARRATGTRSGLHET